jgi:hypothetical protein
MNKTFTLSALVVTALTSGCANFTSPARHHALNATGPQWIDYDASRRGTLLQTDKEGRLIGCAEPAPDIGLSQVNKIKVETTAADNQKNGADLEFSNTAVALAGRTQLVLALREALFRICESSINMNMTKEDTKLLFKTTLKSLSELTEAEKKTADARVMQAEKQNNEAKSSLQRAENEKLRIQMQQ